MGRPRVKKGPRRSRALRLLEAAGEWVTTVRVGALTANLFLKIRCKYRRVRADFSQRRSQAVRLRVRVGAMILVDASLPVSASRCAHWHESAGHAGGTASGRLVDCQWHRQVRAGQPGRGRRPANLKAVPGRTYW